MAIAAISTPHGTGGIAVVRLSGPDAIGIASKVWRGADLAGAKSHSLHLGQITDADGEPLDQCVAALFRGPNSYTGFDTVEFSLHGSPWIQEAVMRRLVEAGASPAGPGEFTRQAFLNGRLDLAQAEGIADLMAASSRASARVALTQVAGGVSNKLRELRERLVTLASLLELELDFSEEDVEFADRRQLLRDVEEIMAEVKRLADSYRRGKIYKEGLSVAIAGVPNAGKSSLLNRLVEEDKALVTDIAGTTRDIIEATAEINGILCRFYDTAGLRNTEDIVEGLGIDRARDRIRSSAVVVWLIDPTQDIESQRQEFSATIGDRHPGLILKVYTKSDITSLKSGEKGLDEGLTISAKSGAGLKELKDAITSIAAGGENLTTQETLLTNLRHYEELRNAMPYLERLKEGLLAQINNSGTPQSTNSGTPEGANSGTPEGANSETPKDANSEISHASVTLEPYPVMSLSTDLLAEELRVALRHIGAITGAITTPDLLQTIFSRFCIGK